MKDGQDQNTISAGLDTLTNFENLTGGNFNDTLTGNSGNNLILGGLGNDSLTGGSGMDTFGFDTVLDASNNIDLITDFNVLQDSIQLDNSIFSRLATASTLNTGNFVSGSGAVALDVDDFLVYDTTSGKLYYDSDGNGLGIQQEILTLTGIPLLTASDIIVV